MAKYWITVTTDYVADLTDAEIDALYENFDEMFEEYQTAGKINWHNESVNID